VPEDKMVEFDEAAFGVIGLETSLGVILTSLVGKDIILPADLVERMSLSPCRILNVPGGTLSVGSPADITIIDPKASWTVDSKYFFSKARNCAFEGYKLQGYATVTIVGGRVVYTREDKPAG
jgi:dihydroorotase